MKKIFILSILGLAVCLTSHAQEGRPGNPIGGIIVKGGKNPGGAILLNVGGGLTTPSSDTKANSFLGSGYNFNIGLYAHKYKFGRDNRFSIGPNISASYFKLNSDVDASPKYNITGQSSAPTATKSGTGNASGFTTEAGLHANFSFGKITASPILNVGYLSFKQNGFKVTQTSQANGQTLNSDLYSQKEIKESGFAFIPKLRVVYFPGKLGLFLESNYTIGPDIISSQSTLKPLGSGNDRDGSYQFDQLTAGKQIVSERETPFKNFAFNFGVSYAIHRTGKKMAKKAKVASQISPSVTDGTDVTNPASQPQNQSVVNTTKSNTKDRVATDLRTGDGTKPTDQPQNQSVVNTTKSNTKDRVATDLRNGDGTNPTGQPQNQSVVNTTKSNTKDRVATDLRNGDGTNSTGQPQNQSVVNTTKSNTKDRVASENNKTMQVTYTGEDPVLKNTQLSILGSGKTLANGTPVVAGRVVGGKITGSIIIASGSARVINTISIKQPESGDEGSAILDNDGNFTISLGSDTLHRIYINDKEFGKIKIESQVVNPLYQDKGNSGLNPLAGASTVAKPGNPIGGIIVKGGKNPGGQMRMISGSDGSFTFQNPKTADFKFTIETPETNGGGGNAARPGEPIGGIIVKGGRNPGGQMLTTSANGNGEVEFKNLLAGNYKFTITAPTEPTQYESFRKGWDGTVKGGSKNSENKENPVYQPQNTEHMSPLYKGN